MDGTPFYKKDNQIIDELQQQISSAIESSNWSKKKTY